MIRYAISRKELETRIAAEAPKWLEKAAGKTGTFRALGRYDETSPSWGEVKAVYLRLQGEGKCAYCERKLENEQYGLGEWDIEHFRPKGGLKPWKPSSDLINQGVNPTPIPTGGGGYHLLPYNPLNYATACRTCNSALKSNYFPIAGTYDLSGDDPVKLKREKPYLIFPVGDDFDEPESLIQFHGVSPQAVAKSGHARRRALVTIEFFHLDDESARKNLLRGRAVVITALFPQLQILAGNTRSASKAVAKSLVEGFTSPNSEHCNCARSFKALYERDTAEAEAVFLQAVGFVSSGS